MQKLKLPEGYENVGIDFQTLYISTFENEIKQKRQRMTLECLRRLGVSTALSYEDETGKPANIFISPATEETKPVTHFEQSKDGIADMVGREDATTKFLPAKNVIDINVQNNLYKIQKSAINGVLDIAKGYNVWVTNAQFCAVIKERKGFEVVGIVDYEIQDRTGIHFIGRIGDVAVYCDPNMNWVDTTVIATSAQKENEEKLKFLSPYETLPNAFTVHVDVQEYGGLV